MKVRSALRRVCKDCYFVRRNGTLYVYCKRMPKHKQRQGFHSSSCPCCAAEAVSTGNQTASTGAAWDEAAHLQQRFGPLGWDFASAWQQVQSDPAPATAAASQSATLMQSNYLQRSSLAASE